jgi:hypothetical protein
VLRLVDVQLAGNCATVWEVSTTILAASSLNSGENFLRFLVTRSRSFPEGSYWIRCPGTVERLRPRRWSGGPGSRGCPDRVGRAAEAVDQRGDRDRPGPEMTEHLWHERKTLKPFAAAAPGSVLMLGVGQGLRGRPSGGHAGNHGGVGEPGCCAGSDGVPG